MVAQLLEVRAIAEARVDHTFTGRTSKVAERPKLNNTELMTEAVEQFVAASVVESCVAYGLNKGRKNPMFGYRSNDSVVRSRYPKNFQFLEEQGSAVKDSGDGARRDA